MIELKLCPFCGGKAEMSEFDQFNDCEISCVSCFCGTGMGKYEETVMRWNSRVDRRCRVRRIQGVKPVFLRTGKGFR